MADSEAKESEEGLEKHQLESKSRDSSQSRGDFKGRQEVMPRTKHCRFEGKDLRTIDFQEVTQPESRSRKSFVKLWAHKERNHESLEGMKLQVSSGNCRDTLSFLEAEKAKVIDEIRKEHEKKLGNARGINVPQETQETTWKGMEVLDRKEKATYSSHQVRGTTDRNERGEPMDEKVRCRGPREEEQNRSVDMEVETKEQQMVERDEKFSEELINLSEKLKQKAANETRSNEERKAQAEAKARNRADREYRIAEVLRNRATAVTERKTKVRAEAEARAQQKRSYIRAPFERVEKEEERKPAKYKDNKGRADTPIFRPHRYRDSESYKSFGADKWAGMVERHAVRSPQARPKEEEEETAERKLQKRARFHYEALRRIEERYNQRIKETKFNDALRTKHVNEIPSNIPRFWDNDTYHSGLHETDKIQLRKLNKKGKGGLNALLSPVVEEPFQDMDESLSEISYEDHDKHVAIFQRIKKAQRRAAEEQRAAAEAKAKQRRAQIKAAVEKAEKARTSAREADRKEKRKGGEYSRIRNNESRMDEPPTKQAPASPRPYTYRRSTMASRDQPKVRIKELNERARSKAEEELERQRLRKKKAKAEERMARLRRLDPDRESVEFYHRLTSSERKEKLAAPTQELNSRFKSPLSSSQKLDSRFKSPIASSQKLDGRFKSSLSNPQDPKLQMRFKSSLISSQATRRTEALEHFANWEKELRTAQLSKARTKERSKGLRVTIQEDPLRKCEKGENPKLTSGSGEKVCKANNLSHNEEYDQSIKSPPRRNQSPVIPVIVPSNQPKPDHYNSIEDDCSCESSYRKEQTKGRAPDEQAKEIAKGAERREKNQNEALTWLGKFYNTIASLT